MKINFNNLRRNAGRALTDLTNILNKNIPRHCCCDLTSQEMQRIMTNLRSTITAIMLTYEEGNPDFANLQAETDKIPHFKQPEDEE